MFVPSTDPNSIDDIDLMAVCVPPWSYYTGLSQYGSRGTREIVDGEWDIVVYEARKMVSLLQQGNPNVLSMLWSPDDTILWATPAGRLLRAERHLFSSKHVYNAFAGYAAGQFKRMTALAFEGYMGEKRKALVQQHGYDTKNAAHLMRLLRMGIEFFQTGELRVRRTEDADELLAIKRGERTLDSIKWEADKLFAGLKGACAASSLPEEVDREAVNDLCQRVVGEELRRRDVLTFNHDQAGVDDPPGYPHKARRFPDDTRYAGWGLTATSELA